MDWLVFLLLAAFAVAWRAWTPYGWSKSNLAFMGLGALAAMLWLLWNE